MYVNGMVIADAVMAPQVDCISDAILEQTRLNVDRCVEVAVMSNGPTVLGPAPLEDTVLNGEVRIIIIVNGVVEVFEDTIPNDDGSA